MKPGTNGRRPRGRPNRKQHGGPSRPNNFDSSGPEGRVRGNAHQVYERYLAMARDAISAGEGIAAETYYQHAEHYFRVLNSSTDPRQNGQGRQDNRGGDGRQDGNRQDRAGPQSNAQGNAHEGQRTSEAPADGQPATPATNGQDAPIQAAQPETRSNQRQRRPAPVKAAPVAPAPVAPVAPVAAVTESPKGNGEASEADNADAQPNPRKDDGDCEPVSVK